MIWAAHFLRTGNLHSCFFIFVPDFLSETCRQITKKVRRELTLSHISNEEIGHLLRESNNQDAAAKGLERFLMEKYDQTCRAKLVFQMLDEAGKQVIVVEDLQRVARDLFSGDDTINDGELMAMIQEFDKSGDGLLAEDDLIRIARVVGL